MLDRTDPFGFKADERKREERKRKAKAITVEVMIAVKVSVDVSAAKAGKKTSKEYAQKLAKKMIEESLNPVRKVNSGFSVATDWVTAEHDCMKIYSNKDGISLKPLV